jgi:stage V sporulation protein G
VEITEVRVKLVNGKNDKLRAFCSITIDNDFVIRDLKVIDGAKGPFVAMPSRKLMERCSKCGSKNHYRAKYCNDCGGHVGGDRHSRTDEDGGDSRGKLHVEIAHPINSQCREVIQREVLDRYEGEYQRSQLPGYQESKLQGEEEYEDYFQDDSARSTGRDTPAAERPSREADPTTGAGAGAAKPALDDPQLAPEWKKKPSVDAHGPGHRSAVESDRQASEQRPIDGEKSDRSTSADYRQAPEPGANPATGPSTTGKDLPGESAHTKGPFKDPGAEDSEPEDNFGAGIFS